LEKRKEERRGGPVTGQSDEQTQRATLGAKTKRGQEKERSEEKERRV
jgi:hypothetical protein